MVLQGHPEGGLCFINGRNNRCPSTAIGPKTLLNGVETDEFSELLGPHLDHSGPKTAVLVIVGDALTS